ncbi:hypothetical protein [Agreia sp. COWG]|uniref:hypothetical protein n=1 Tax=Agreia sp. COWG TaxID=2773266 RepID=UPI001926BDA0|nr:hypothetical protein [Agreia sp. COWG]CAD6016044.1 conserved exported protein of unknown function [Agreia sp. COWG]
MSARKRRPRLGWIVLLSVAGALIVGAIATALVLQLQGGKTDAAPASATPSAAAGSDGGGAGANGCLAGPGITAEQLEQIRAKKDLTPTGAVEFLGAFTQFINAGDPNYRAGVERVVQDMTTGAAEGLFTNVSSVSGPAGGDNYNVDLSQGYYRVVTADPSKVVVDIMALSVRNGTPVSTGDGKLAIGGGEFTLIPSDTGWLVSAGSADVTFDQVRSTGYRFEDGC